MEEIKIEIDEELLEQLNRIIQPLGWTSESLAEQFLRFCADPKNYDEVKAFFDKCKEEGMA